MTNSTGGGDPVASLDSLANSFQSLVRTMIDGKGTLELDAVVDYARSAVPGADDGSITIVARGRDPETLGATGSLALEADQLQYQLNEGPCMEALGQSDLVWVNDLARDTHFPRFAPEAVGLGVRSMLSTRLFLTENDRAGLNLYSKRTSAFSSSDLPLAAIFASYASLLLMNRLHEDKVLRLERALESNREIGVAMGILMAQRRWSQAEAFERLVTSSQHLNRRLRDIAAEVTSTRRLPRPNRRNGASADDEAGSPSRDAG
jgi:GAF domain-containing protein